MDKDEVDRTLAFLHRPRPCRVCGTTFRPERWDALVCCPTCKARRLRGQDLAYLDGLTQATEEEHQRLHKDVAASIAVLKAHNADERERRRQRQVDQELGQIFQIVRTNTVN